MKYIERDIVIGSIVSTEYLRELKELYKPRFIQAKPARTIIGWSLTYFSQYKQAPQKAIQSIYASKEEGMQSEESSWIAEILEFLSEEYEENDQFNSQYLIDETIKYFRQRQLEILQEDLEANLSNNQISDAERLIYEFKSADIEVSSVVDPFTGTEIVRKAFEYENEKLITFPGAVGILLNDQLIRDGFVALMGPEKRGKSFWLLEMAFRAVRNKCRVAFFQAGDMSEAQQIRRMYVYMAKRSYKKRYCTQLYVPVLDCEKNQRGTCKLEERQSNYGVFEDIPEKTIEQLTYNDYTEYYQDNPDYKPCKVCYRKDMRYFPGAYWLMERPKVPPLTWKEAVRAREKYFKTIKAKSNRLKMVTYPNDSLSVAEIENQLDKWEEREGFIADVVIIDYADLLVPSERTEYRHQQNQIWKRLRALSQKKHNLVITATQADADSYDKKNIGLSNFSEDKRKYGHVTAMFSLNQTKEEKKKGILRLGELVLRDDDYSIDRQIKILGRLQIGRPYLESFF